MFEKIAEHLPDKVDLNFTIRKDGENLTVMVLPQGILNKVKPMIISGTPKQIDEHFASSIGEALKASSEVFIEVKAYEETLKEKQKELEEKKKKKDVTKKPATVKKDEEEDEKGENLFNTAEEEDETNGD